MQDGHSSCPSCTPPPMTPGERGWIALCLSIVTPSGLRSWWRRKTLRPVVAGAYAMHFVCPDGHTASRLARAFS